MNNFLKDAGNAAVQVQLTQMQMMDEAMRQIQIHVPAEECHMESMQSRNEYTLVCRGLPMFTSRCDMMAQDLQVEGWWVNWPPPERSMKKGKFSLVDPNPRC